MIPHPAGCHDKVHLCKELIKCLSLNALTEKSQMVSDTLEWEAVYPLGTHARSGDRTAEVRVLYAPPTSAPSSFAAEMLLCLALSLSLSLSLL